jgi:beta-glucanase (GH16 family)
MNGGRPKSSNLGAAASQREAGKMTLQRALLLTVLLCLDSNLAQANPSVVLDMSDLELSFSENFDHLDVSAWGPGTRWIAHTPWKGDFGSARFADPQQNFPFTVADGHLRIEALKGPDGKWRSGLLASVDAAGRGFAQKFGYFEIRAKLPAGKGLWPAFWLVGLDRLDRSTTHTAEVDIIEHYGHMPDRYTAAIHVWDRAQRKRSVTQHRQIGVRSGSLYEAFHTYGARIDEHDIRFYFDRREVWSVPTPPEQRQPMFLLLNLGLGAGWPIDAAPSPSFMYVDYVRVWQSKR